MGIKEKPGVESETWEESKTKVKIFLKEKMGLDTEERKNWKEGWVKTKDHQSKIFKLQVAWESVKQIQGAEIMARSNLHKWRFQWVYCWQIEHFV